MQQVEEKRLVAVMGLDKVLHCDHEFVPITTGGMHFSAGEVWDDIRIEYQCKFCNAFMPDIDYEPEPTDGPDDEPVEEPEIEDTPF